MKEINKLYTTEEAMAELGITDIHRFRKLCNKTYLGKHKIKRIPGTNLIPHSELVRISNLNY